MEIISYRIQKRKYSSNIIEIGVLDENNKIKWTPYIAPLISKVEGDIVAERILELLTKTENK